MRPISKAVMLLTLGILFLLSGKSWSQDPIEVEITSRIRSHGQGDSFSVNEETIYGNNFIATLYKDNGNKLVWNDNSIMSLKSEIQNMESDGLNPGDYWSDSITKLINEKSRDSLTAASVVDLDILLSEAFIRAYYNLLVGKVDPEALDTNFNFPKILEVERLLPVVIAKVREGKISESLNDVRLKNIEHVNLKKALAQYKTFQANGGWAAIDGGKTLKPGQHNPRVVQLRARLGVTEDYTGNADISPFYDTDLETAVKHFQKRHGLDIDGVVGANTLAALNISVEQKIDQIRVNLERQRWYMHENFGEFVVVDIAGFNVYWVKDGEILWETRSQVGTNYNQTPVFKDNIRSIEFNPTWTIPPGIMRRSILPGLKKDPDYLDKKGYLLLTQDGKEVDPKTVDWDSVKTMPYMVRQPAGPTNALGLVKFLFPNKHMVYLHDTNHREHFADASRSFSSGCVRIDKPFDFAERLLAGQDGWTRQKIDEVVASGKTVRVNLDKPVRIIIAYNTVTLREDGIYFKPDVYKRDKKLLAALDGSFKLRASEQQPAR